MQKNVRTILSILSMQNLLINLGNAFEEFLRPWIIFLFKDKVKDHVEVTYKS